MTMTESRQKQVIDWAMETFGAVSGHRDERAARLVEEAIEVAQCQDLPEAVVERILRRVYSRPPGNLLQEIGGVAITLDALAENAGICVATAADTEFTRVRGKSKAHFAAKHAEKVAAGVADLSATGRNRAGEIRHFRRHLRDIRLQLVIDTGAGTMCPVSDDYFVDLGMMHACDAGGLLLDDLDKTPAVDAAAMINDGLTELHGHDGVPRTKAFLENLLDDCLANPKAFVSVIEVSAPKTAGNIEAKHS